MLLIEFTFTFFKFFFSANSVTSSSEEWKAVQEEMLRSYLATAQSDLIAKKVRKNVETNNDDTFLKVDF